MSRVPAMSPTTSSAWDDISGAVTGLPYMAVEDVEQAVEDFYATVRLPEDAQKTIGKGCESSWSGNADKPSPRLPGLAHRTPSLDRGERGGCEASPSRG
jgi:hypothetical protein